MKKKISVVIAGTAVGILAAVGSAGPASAGHCVAPTGEPSAPGFSYFGTDHVQETDHNGAAPGQSEGGKTVHMGNPGASNCRETTGSPSERAPGRK